MMGTLLPWNVTRKYLFNGSISNIAFNNPLTTHFWLRLEPLSIFRTGETTSMV